MAVTFYSGVTIALTSSASVIKLLTSSLKSAGSAAASTSAAITKFGLYRRRVMIQSVAGALMIWCAADEFAARWGCYVWLGVLFMMQFSTIGTAQLLVTPPAFGSAGSMKAAMRNSIKQAFAPEQAAASGKRGRAVAPAPGDNTLASSSGGALASSSGSAVSRLDHDGASRAQSEFASYAPGDSVVSAVVDEDADDARGRRVGGGGAQSSVAPRAVLESSALDGGTSQGGEPAYSS